MSKKEYFSLDKILPCDTHYFIFLERGSGVNYVLSKILHKGDCKQESILDNVIEEIMDTGAYEQEVNGKTEFLKGINYCLGVINKYRQKGTNK